MKSPRGALSGDQKVPLTFADISSAVHYPEQTLAIVITRKEDGQPIRLISSL
ncbi:hypothetical protein [Streptosporangium roseum]|uniref:hypothetical protein n=1 Tax=Streptosporangium roseum TaxID=2001 RepID=UPI003331911E